MSEFVFILGAGASKVAGAPLMNDFLDVADRLRRTNKVDKEKADFDLVFKARGALQAAHSKAQLDINNIESVYGAFEMARLLNSLAPLQSADLARLPVAMRQVIVKTLESTIVFKRPNKEKVLPPAPYDSFLRLIGDMCEAGYSNSFDRVSVITFNYDLCFDYACHFYGLPLNYCLTEPYEVGLKFLKLHGSLNWIKCEGEKCGKAVPWSMRDFFSKRNWAWHSDATEVHLSVSAHFNSFMHCGFMPSEPLIVPPTWNKAQYHESIESVWQSAARELATAENIFVCGFSYPPTDEFFRYLYALGTIGQAPFKNFIVFDPVDTVEKRFSDLLGPAAQGRFRFIEQTFGDAIGTIRSMFGIKESR
jgi:hypothetical protein